MLQVTSQELEGCIMSGSGPHLYGKMVMVVMTVFSLTTTRRWMVLLVCMWLVSNSSFPLLLRMGLITHVLWLNGFLHTETHLVKKQGFGMWYQIVMHEVDVLYLLFILTQFYMGHILSVLQGITFFLRH